MAHSYDMLQKFESDPNGLHKIRGIRGLVEGRPRGITLYFLATDPDLQVLAYSIAGGFVNEGKQAKAVEYRPHHLRTTDTAGRYVFVLDQPAVGENDKVREERIKGHVKAAGRMVRPEIVWLMDMPYTDTEPITVYDLLEQLRGTVSQNEDGTLNFLKAEMNVIAVQF